MRRLVAGQIQDALVAFHAPETFRNHLLQQFAETGITLQVLAGAVAKVTHTRFGEV